MHYLLILLMLFKSSLITHGIEVWRYHESPLTYEEARADCKKQGLHLATIITDGDRENAAEAIPSIGESDSEDGSYPDAPWVGLYHNSEQNEFSFVFDDGQQCPKSSGKCVSFWNNDGPRDINPVQGTGYYCTQYLEDNGYDNYKDCDETGPYLCSGNIPTYTGEYIVVAESDVSYYTWSDAQRECEELYGSDLATILTENDLNKVYNLMESEGAYRAFIGLNDRSTEGVFEWVDGTECAIEDDKCSQFWEEGQPDNRGDYYLIIRDSDCVYLDINEPGFGYEMLCDRGDLSTGLLNEIHRSYVCNKPFNIEKKEGLELIVYNGDHFRLFLNIASIILFVLIIGTNVYYCGLIKNQRNLKYVDDEIV